MKKDWLTLLLVDILTLNSAWLMYYTIRVESGWFQLSLIPDIWIPALVVTIYWLAIFWFIGLYIPRSAKSRFDEFTLIVKAVLVGVLILFFLIFYDDARSGEASVSRMLISIYWIIMIVFVTAGRMTVRTVRRKMLEAGIGLRNTLIVGTPEKAADLYDRLALFPALGYKVIGFISTSVNGAANGVAERRLFVEAAHFGDLAALEPTIASHNVQDIILTLESSEHEQLLDVMGRCANHNVGIKILPDLYDIVSGQARTNQIYGIPLIEITPQLLQPWEAVTKRIVDIVISIIILSAGLPAWLLVALAIEIDSRGPVFYRQKRVGKDGKIFRIFKFRSMTANAESISGPTWAEKNDPRVTRIGRIIRRTHLDEVPQFLNVLAGDMSLVGPRPERPFFVEQFIAEIPLYRRRLNVHPGITGWAQVRHKYDESVDDVRTKLRYDLFYIENMSLRMDFKILIQTMYNIFTAKGHA